jgi:hypothetical protein
MHLSEKALLVNLSVSQWVARKLDREASNAIAAQHGAVANSGNYNKSLLPTCDELDAIKTKTSVIRKEFYKNTLIWDIEGMFILPSANYLDFTTKHRKNQSEWLALVHEFIRVYPQRRLEAKQLLSTLFKDSDYPTVDSLTRKFDMDLKFHPVPTSGDFRVELSEAELERVRSNAVQRVEESSQAAMADVWQRLYDKVAWLADRLSDPKNTFHDATYQDAQDTCELLTRLNFTDDANLEKMRLAVSNKLVKFHPETLRNDPDVRRDTLKDANAIMKQMAVFMGDAA